MSLSEPLNSAVPHSKLLVMSANKFSLVTRSMSVTYTRETQLIQSFLKRTEIVIKKLRGQYLRIQDKETILQTHTGLYIIVLSIANYYNLHHYTLSPLLYSH